MEKLEKLFILFAVNHFFGPYSKVWTQR